MVATVRGLDLRVPPVSVVVTTTPSCHSSGILRDAVGGPLSVNVYVRSLAAVSVSTSSAMMLSWLDEALQPRDRRRPGSGPVAGGTGEVSFNGHEVLVGSSCSGRRRRGSMCSGEASTSEPRFFCVKDDVGGLDNCSGLFDIVGPLDDDSQLGTFAKVFAGSRFDCRGLADDVGGLERSSSV